MLWRWLVEKVRQKHDTIYLLLCILLKMFNIHIGNLDYSCHVLHAGSKVKELVCDYASRKRGLGL